MDFVEAHELRKRYHEASKAVILAERCLRYCNEAKREFWERELEKCQSELTVVESEVHKEMVAQAMVAL